MYQIINSISAFSVLLPISAAIYFYKRYNVTFKILSIFFFVSGIFDLALIVLTRVGFMNNAPLIHLFVCVNILFFGIVYYQTLLSSILKKTIIFAIPCLMVITVLNALFVEGIWAFPSISNTAQSILFIVFSLTYFYQLLNRSEYVYIEKQGLFWINAGVLIYFSSNFFLFMLYNRMLESQDWNLWIIHSIANIIANIFYTIGLSCKPAAPKSYQYS